ncbi:ABC transporter ATP-binding protein [Fusibacter sp. JL298sf-3]
MAEQLIELKGVTKVYGKGALKVEALKGIDLSIEPGYFYAIIGKSGSGKSTLLHILGALDKPTDGEMYLEGQNVFDQKEDFITLLRRRRIGFVFQSFNLLPEHTVLENILLPAHLDGVEPEQKHLDEIVDTLDIREKLNYYPDELSGGQRQRVAIARALVTNPAIILADEPTGNLDENTGKEVMALLKASAKRFNQTLILVTHDLGIASEADRVIEISNGHVISSI